MVVKLNPLPALEGDPYWPEPISILHSLTIAIGLEIVRTHNPSQTTPQNLWWRFWRRHSHGLKTGGKGDARPESPKANFCSGRRTPWQQDKPHKSEPDNGEKPPQRGELGPGLLLEFPPTLAMKYLFCLHKFVVDFLSLATPNC